MAKICYCCSERWAFSSSYGKVEADGFHRLDQFPESHLSKLTFSESAFSCEGMKYLPVVQSPSKLFAVGRNYAAHIAEIGGDRPEAPLFWFKAPSSLIGHQSAVIIPYPEHRTDFEVELAIVISKAGKDIPVESAREHILGYTTALDITDRTIQKAEGQWARSKSFDTFTPLGPSIETELDTSDLRIQLFQNGELRQDGRTSMMLFNCEQIVSHASRGITLNPNDVILTGTPSGIGPIASGDVLEARIEGLDPLIVTVE